MRREIFTVSPPQGDYILNPTGYTWHVRRATGTGSVLSVSTTSRTRKDGLATMLSMAEADRADAWENDGAGSFRLVKRFRSSPVAPAV
jgi:hypothetical protein